MNRIAPWLAAAAVWATFSSTAAPVAYTLTLDATLGTGPAGTATFTYDSSTQQGSGLTWNFGGGETGGVFDAFFVDNPGTAQLLFDNILRNLVDDPASSGYSMTPTAVGGSTFGPFGENSVSFCWGILSDPTCGMPNPGTAQASYRFVDNVGDGGEIIYRGYLSLDIVNETPEPAMWALLLAAMLSAGIVPAWQRRAATSVRPLPPRR